MNASCQGGAPGDLVSHFLNSVRACKWSLYNFCVCCVVGGSLGGGLGGHKESGQLRFGGRDRPFRKPM